MEVWCEQVSLKFKWLEMVICCRRGVQRAPELMSRLRLRFLSYVRLAVCGNLDLVFRYHHGSVNLQSVNQSVRSAGRLLA